MLFRSDRKSTRLNSREGMSVVMVGVWFVARSKRAFSTNARAKPRETSVRATNGGLMNVPPVRQVVFREALSLPTRRRRRPRTLRSRDSLSTERAVTLSNHARSACLPQDFAPQPVRTALCVQISLRFLQGPVDSTGRRQRDGSAQRGLSVLPSCFGQPLFGHRRPAQSIVVTA